MTTSLPETLGLDTNCIVYYIETVGDRAAYLAEHVVGPMERGRLAAVTSVVTLAEILVPALRAGDANRAEELEQVLLTLTGLTVLAADAELMKVAAAIRAVSGLRLLDCIQLGAARLGGATAFLTNDRRMQREGTGIEVLILDDLLAAAATGDPA